MIKILTPEQIKQAQLSLDLSDSQFALVLGFDNPQGIRRLKIKNQEATSFRKIRPAQIRLIQAYLEGYRPKDWPIK